MPGTNKRYPCVGMEKICRDYENLHGLRKNSLKERTLRGFVVTNEHIDLPLFIGIAFLVRFSAV